MYNSRKDQIILIVEDSLTQAQKLAYCLQESGYQYVLANTGKQGLETMVSHSPSLVISDIVMPEMDGYEFCKAAKSNENLKEIPIILLTSLSDTSDILRGLECGADNFITKPYEEAYLLARVDYILANRELRKRDKLHIGVNIEFAGRQHFITSERQQILDLLISTYEQAVQINTKLKKREKELEETNLYLSALNTIGNIVNKSLNLDKILNEVLAKLIEILDIDIAGIFLIEADKFQLKAHKGLPKEFAQKQLVEAILKFSEVIKDPTELKLLPIDVLAKADGVEAIMHLDLGFFMCVPLKVKNQFIGAMLFCMYEERDFRQADIELIQNISNQIAATTENARLYELTRSQRIEEQAALLSLSQYLLSTFDIDEITAKTIETAKELLKADFCGIFFPDAQNQSLILKASIGSSSQTLKGLELPIDQETDIVYTFLKKEPLCIFDSLEQSRFQTPNQFITTNLLSTINIPILLNNNILGVLSVKTKEKRFFTIEDVHLLSLLTSKVAIAIQNAQAKKALRESEEKYRLLFEVSPQATWVYDIDTLRFLAVNQTATTRYGYSQEEFLSMTINDIQSDTSKGDVPNSSEELNFSDTWKHCKKDGSIIWVEVVSYPINFSNQKAMLVIATDVTERKQILKTLEDERALLAKRVQERTADLSNVNSQLVKANRLKDEFLASMSHELRTPLNAILGMSENLKENIYGTLNEKQLKAIKTVEESGQHLLSLINDILDVSKINAGKFELDINSIEVETLAETSLRLVKQLAYQKNISITSRVASNVQNFRGDSRRLKQALVNLLSNAIKFTPQNGSIGLEILGDEGKQISFTVWDTGVGIAFEDIEKLFVPFIQLDSSLARENVGTGLGLSLVRGIAELHGGGVALESELGKGSRFTISLPWYHSHQQVKSLTKQITRTSPIQVEKVFIIEDSNSSANQLARYLVDIGSTTIEFSDGSNALERVLEVKPDLIILDILLSDSLGITGWDILKQFKADVRTEKIPVLVISVLDEENKNKALGASAYLAKPVTRETLLFALRKIGYRQNNPIEILETLPTQNSPKILIVEDNQFNLDIIYDYLLSNSYHLIIARNGKEAIEVALENKPDLILMDIQMPKMDGFEATRLIRINEDLKHIPIIAMTALAMQGDKERCLQAGMNDYITKPINFKKLLELIKEYFKN